jgi:membrane-associated protease RseP (regulator of RpoE activity)
VNGGARGDAGPGAGRACERREAAVGRRRRARVPAATWRSARVAGAFAAALAAALLGAGGGCEPAWHGGIHARMGWSQGRGLRVIEVPEGPARDAGLREGDRIVSIDGAPVEGRSERDVVARLRGEVGSRVRLGVLRGDESLELTVERAPYRARRR